MATVSHHTPAAPINITAPVTELLLDPEVCTEVAQVAAHLKHLGLPWTTSTDSQNQNHIDFRETRSGTMWHRSVVQPSVLFIILQLCGLPMSVVNSPVCSLQGILLESSHHLLRDVGGPFPVPCVQYNANISFPKSVLRAATDNLSECRQVSWLVFESLQGAWNVFEDYNVTFGEDGLNWNEVNFDNFQNLQYQVLEDGSCLSGFRSSHLLSLYFDDVRTVLQQGSAACGWEALRRDLLWVLKIALQKYHTCFTWRQAK
ncbi:interferon phi 2 [Betta splendens]|uniref:Interferon phi 2 n=1 Tax=Betta splendens TaxID=158456 RepID=A0A6P7NBG1_BETSP|nr:interferon phi 2 [Betta splendens]